MNDPNLTDDASVYLVLGCAGSGRHALVDDLIQDGFDPGEPVSVTSIMPEGKPAPSLRASHRVVTHARAIPAPSPGETLFIITDGWDNPAVQIENFQQWLPRKRASLARILAVINCQLLAREPALTPWFDCIIHFADCVLCTQKDEVGQKWLRDFQERYTKQHYPCLFPLVKKGRIANPPLVLDPVPRRMSLLFDDIDAVDRMDIDPDNLPDETIDLVAPPDPWLERLPSGHHAKPLPAIRDFIT